MSREDKSALYDKQYAQPPRGQAPCRLIEDRQNGFGLLQRCATRGTES
jgi:hypothetical protein